MGRRSGFAVIALALASASAACAAVFGFERLSDDGADGGGVDASDAADVVQPDAPNTDECGAIGVPDPPAITDGGVDAPAETILALKVIDLGIDGGSPQIPGFNLDKTCSVDLATSSCTTPVDEVTFEKYAKDHGDHGLDNTGYGLIQYLGSLGDAFKPESVNARLQAGEYGALVRITRWNGGSDDDDVFVEVFPALGLVGDAGPTFAPADQWVRDTRFRVAGGLDASSIKSLKGYVTGGRLVAFFQDLTLPISVPDDPKKLDIKTREVWLSGDLANDASGTRLTNATIGGRWKTSDFLGEVREIFLKDTLGVKNKYLCESGLPQTAYNAVKKEACDGRDVRAASRDDNTKAACDSLSIGWRFDTYGVSKSGPFQDPPTLPARCVDAAVPAGDDCATE
jgi:hypothetical protein